MNTKPHIRFEHLGREAENKGWLKMAVSLYNFALELRPVEARGMLVGANPEAAQLRSRLKLIKAIDGAEVEEEFLNDVCALASEMAITNKNLRPIAVRVIEVLLSYADNSNIRNLFKTVRKFNGGNQDAWLGQDLSWMASNTLPGKSILDLVDNLYKPAAKKEESSYNIRVVVVPDGVSTNYFVAGDRVMAKGPYRGAFGLHAYGST